MMNRDDIPILDNDDTKSLIDRHLYDDPYSLAFTLKCDPRQSVLVRGQIRNLKKAERKIPSYFRARCIIPTLSYEQCSSEAAAGRKNYSGGLCIDLTCGLGVDAFQFSRSFSKVVAVERSEALAEVAAVNFARLGASGIEVVHACAEDFVNEYCGEKADLVYLDPARRKEGRKVFLLDDCSPNVLSMIDGLLRIGRKIVVKLSPLFDLDELFRKFGDHLSSVRIVSVERECKEILAELEESPAAPPELIVSVDNGEYRFPAASGPPDRAPFPGIDGYSFLLIPDPAFYKGRVVRRLFEVYHPDAEVAVPSENGFAFACRIPAGFHGRAYRIVSVADYRPKEIRKELKRQGVTRFNILRRDFPWTTESVKKSLGITEGGVLYGAFTAVLGRNLFISVVPEKV